MAETLRIEIPIETIDNTDPELSSVTRNFERMEKAAESANSAAKKAGSSVTKFDRNAQKTEKSLKGWVKGKYQVLLEAKDRIMPVLSTIGRGLKSFAGKTWRISMRAIDLVTSPVRGIINLLKNPIFQVGAVLGVSIGLKDTIDTYKDFEAAMSQVQAVSGATGSDLEKLTEKAKEMGATTKFTATESAEAFNYMAMAGWKTDEMLGGIEGILNLAAASGESLATTSDIVTDALTAFGMQASDAGHFSDVLAVASSNANTNVSMMGETFKYVGAASGALGYSIEDVALGIGLMANAGIKASQAGTELNSIFTRLATDTNGSRNAIEALGISFYKSDGSTRAYGDVLADLREATKDMTQEQKVNFANTVAGQRAQAGLLAMLNASEKDYRKLTDSIKECDGAATEMADTMLDNLQGSLTLMQSAVDGVKNSFGERLSPYVRGLADWIAAQMPAVEQGLEEFMDWVDIRVGRMQKKFDEITSTKEWQDADFLGKVKIAWDEFIAEPFSEWWNSTGKAKFAGFAQDIGSGIGSGLKFGIMTMLGIDIGETLDEGASIGASFAKGFSEGFDFEEISKNLWKGFQNLLSSAGKLLPGGEAADLSSIFSLMMLSRIATPFIGMGRGAFSVGRSLFGSSTGGTSLAALLLGSTGNAMVSGSGILGGLANVGYGLAGGGQSAGMYFGSMAGTMSGGSAALLGAGSVAGGVIGAAGLVHGAMDLYTGFTSEDEAKAAAYKKAGAIEVGGTLAGAGAGAATGAAIGAFFGGAGAVPGALIGAGVGAIGSWIAGNKVKEKYHKDVEEMQKEAEKAQKVFAATGLAIEDVKFKNEALTGAMNDSEVSAEEFARMLQEECANVAKEAFGDIHLSLEEVRKLASEITFADLAEGMDEFSKAASDTQQALSALESSASNLKKADWKVSLGMKMSEEDWEGYRETIEGFVKSAQNYIDNSHYQATVALKLVKGDEADTFRTDSIYQEWSSKVEEFQGVIDEVFKNGVVSDKENVKVKINGVDIWMNEESALAEAQKQISDITNKMAEAQNEASLDLLKIKYSGSGAGMDSESYAMFQEELKNYTDSAVQTLDDAYISASVPLKLKLQEGGLSNEEAQDIQRQLRELEDAYNEQVRDLNNRVQDFQIDTIAQVWGSRLDGILPDIEGTLSEKLKTAMENALLAKPDVEAWTPDDVKGWFDLGGIDTEAFRTIFEQLKQTASMAPQEVKDAIKESFQGALPTATELREGIDWESLTYEARDEMVNALIPGRYGNESFASAGEKFDAGAFITDNMNFDTMADNISQEIADALQNSTDAKAVEQWLDTYYKSVEEAASDLDFNSVMAEYGPISDEYYSQIVSEWQEAGTAYGDALNTGVSTSLASGSQVIRRGIQTALDTATASPYAVSPRVNVTPKFNIAGSNSFTFSMDMNDSSTDEKGVKRNAAGGYVSGGPQLSWLAEEGYGEFIIPTNPSRRTRAMELYKQAGAALGVSAHAAGGYAGEPIRGIYAAGYNGIAGDSYEAGIPQTYEPVPAGRESSPGGSPVQINVNITPEFTIHGSEGQSEEDIWQVIRRHMREMADELGGEIAGKLEDVFSNMPLKEA